LKNQSFGIDRDKFSSNRQVTKPRDIYVWDRVLCLALDRSGELLDRPRHINLLHRQVLQGDALRCTRQHLQTAAATTANQGGHTAPFLRRTVPQLAPAPLRTRGLQPAPDTEHPPR